MTSKLNKPEKDNTKVFPNCYQKSITLEVNKTIDEMDAYYKQFIKDNIPSEGEITFVIEDSKYGSTHPSISKAIHKFIKKRLQV